jgi:SAM-dependent methyltransferase
MSVIPGLKDQFGGGEREWEHRGRSQLELLKRLGLLPWHALLDAGCGPLRGGVHFIDYLDPGHYYGLDCNPQFIEFAKSIVSPEKKVTLKTTCDFDSFGRTFDYVVCFGVLKNCSAEEQRFFIEEMGRISHRLTRIILSHPRLIAHELNSFKGLFGLRKLALPGLEYPDSDTVDLFELTPVYRYL